MKTKITPFLVIFFFFWIVALIGGVGAILTVAGAEIGDGDAYNGVFHEVHRNSSFFNSSNQTINSLLVVPQYFFGTYNGQWGMWNIFLGFLSFLVLLSIFPLFLFFKEENKKLNAFIFGVFGFLYTSYWLFATVFVVIRLISGERITEVYTWS